MTQKKEQETTAYSVKVSQIKMYVNEHHKNLKTDPTELEVMAGNISEHPFQFKLVAAADTIAYQVSQSLNNIETQTPRSVTLNDSPDIPMDKTDKDFYLVFSKDNKELSRFPKFRFIDYADKQNETGYQNIKNVEVKQLSTDGKMMVYLSLTYNYDY